MAASLIALALAALLAARRRSTSHGASALGSTRALGQRVLNPRFHHQSECRLGFKIAVLLVAAILLLGFVAVDFLRLVIRLRDIP